MIYREVINMLEQINVLREKLEKQVIEDYAYDQIVETSKKIDALLVDYYRSLQIIDVAI